MAWMAATTWARKTSIDSPSMEFMNAIDEEPLSPWSTPFGFALVGIFYLLPFRVLLQSAIQNPKSRIQNHVSALRPSYLGHGHGQAIGARMHGLAPWKTEETIVGLPRLLVLSVFSRFGGRHISPFDPSELDMVSPELMLRN